MRFFFPRTPPGEIRLPEHFPGLLLWGGLSPALSTPWLRSREVVLVVNCIGKFDKKGLISQQWTLAQTAREADAISYKHWCINRSFDQMRYLPIFNTIRAVLDQPAGVVYIHCKSGKDRSAFTVYSFLQLMYGVSEDQAREAVGNRLDTSGRRLANLDFQQDFNRDWLERMLRAQARA